MEIVYRASLLVFICHIFQVEARLRRDRDAQLSASSTPQPPFQFIHHDCGHSHRSMVRFVNVSMTPSPIRAPGRVRLSTLVNVTELLPMTLSADVIVSKYFYGIPLKVPCYNNIGTCHYKNVCGLLETVFPTDEDCPRILKRHGIPCRCPFDAGVYHLRRWLLHLPPLGGVLESLATGEYDVRLRLYDTSNKTELACLQLKFHMKRQRKRKPPMMMTTTMTKMMKTTTTMTKMMKTTTTTTTTNDI